MKNPVNDLRSQQERRSHPRLEKDIPLKLRFGEFDIVTKTKNISCAGVYCSVDRYLEPLTKLKILLLLPLSKEKKVITKKVQCNGVVVRAEGPFPNPHHYDIAIFFNDIEKKESKKIADFVNCGAR
ncbi:PilZ domain-containing protein [Candidatus Omnitrophota bacterium]